MAKAKKGEETKGGDSPPSKQEKSKKDGSESPGPLKKEKSKTQLTKKEKLAAKKEKTAVVAVENTGGGLLDDGKEVAAAGEASKKKKLKQMAKAETKAKNLKKAPPPKKSGKKGPIMKFLEHFGIGLHDIHITDSHCMEVVALLDLNQKHLHRLRRQFDHIDLDGSGSIDTVEFLDAVGEQRSPFTDRLFSIIDIDGSGSIDFDEFIRVLGTYCMFTKDDIMRFCFECFDVDGSGTIDEKEFVELCKVINNASPIFPKNFKDALESFDVNEDGLIDYAEFLEMEKRFPMVLFPAFRLQDRMQKISLGESAWLRIMENVHRGRRIEEYKATHGGKMPPDPLPIMLAKLMVPCLFYQHKPKNMHVMAKKGHDGDDGKGEKKKKKKLKEEH